MALQEKFFTATGELAADLLQSIINKAKDQGLLNLPIPLQYTNDFPILRYADDTLVIMEGCGRQTVFS